MGVLSHLRLCVALALQSQTLSMTLLDAHAYWVNHLTITETNFTLRKGVFHGTSQL